MSDCNSTCAAIMAANSESEVISIVRGYLSSFSMERAALVPPSLIAVGIDHAKEIAQAAVEVAHREAQAIADGPEATFLKEVGAVLSTAAMKLVVLACGEQTQAA
ncbi:MAG TPA: hypothetical protein VH040_15505 [Usitatibacter sp.]|jgi:hypothetical protein|nr:hypothetical protein [Usitatibacter sp.]